MTLNLAVKDQYYYCDEHGMMLVQGDEESWRDSIGRNFLFLEAYGWNMILPKGLNDCYRDGKLYRHPNKAYQFADMSKDHWSYYIMYKRGFSNDTFKEFVDTVPRMAGLYNWMYALAGYKYDEIGYYLVQIPGAYLGNMLHSLGKLHKNRKLIVPPYSLHNKAWQVSFMPKSRAKAKLQKILLRRVMKHDPTNYLLRLLFGDTTVTKAEVDSYQCMSGYRWGVFLDWSNDRDVHVLDPAVVKYNGYDKELLNKLWVTGVST